MDFGALPPEINSALMYSGSGSSSLQAAASAWNGLAAELSSAATGYDRVITELASDEWMGPASASMAGAAQPYVSWMTTTAAQAEQAAAQARSASAAYEQAFAATVPPPLVASNRALVSEMLQANVFGQYTPAISQLEGQYGEMWAQDSAAMYNYAGQSAAAAQVTPFASPAATTNPAGTATQAAAVSTATGSSAATGSQSILQQLTSSLPTSLQGLASPTSAATTSLSPLQSLFSLVFGTTVLPTSLSALFNDYSPFAGVFYNTEGLPYFSVGMGNFGIQMAKTLGLLGGAGGGGGAAAGAATGGLGGLGGMLGGGHAAAAGSGVSASMGEAGVLGELSVPPSWVGSTPLAAPHSPLPISHVSAAPEGAGNMMGGVPFAGPGAGHMGGSGPRYGFKPTVMSRPPFAG
ncbi:MAG TPA: PPE domain-containing protein [Mycobacterium sp.]|uniref:PPE family protein n=1 Tax=Mycobacterium sp. TaxID=1785 RepID=UPI002F3FAB98